MKKIWILSLMIFLILPLQTLAAVPEVELTPYLSEIGMTQEELEDHLYYYDRELASFTTLAELQEFVGPVITEENLTEMLTRLAMTREELTSLLGEFGETIEDYTFIKDLEDSVHYYQDAEDEMVDIEKQLADIGLTEEEVDKIYQHFLSLDEEVLDQRMNELAAKYEELLSSANQEELTEAQQEALINMMEEMFGVFGLKPRFFLVDPNGAEREVSMANLENITDFGEDSLKVALYTTTGTLLADMQLSPEMLESGFGVESLDEMLKLGALAETQMEKTLPNTATPYGNGMVAAIILLVFGGFTLLYGKRLKRG